MIGFKEFHEYLQLSPEERNTEDGQKLLSKGISDLKQATRRYARQQIRWITNRFCNRPGVDVPPIYSVDSTDLTQWDKAVEEAIEVVRAFTLGKIPSKVPEIVNTKVDTQLVRNVCHVCGGRIFLHLHEWSDHLRSKKHKFCVKLAVERSKLSHLLATREQMLKQQTTLTGDGTVNTQDGTVKTEDSANQDEDVNMDNLANQCYNICQDYVVNEDEIVNQVVSESG